MRKVIHIPTGETALAQPGCAPGRVALQFDRFDHPQSHGWFDYPEDSVRDRPEATSLRDLGPAVGGPMHMVLR